ncbi:disease resistance RPP13-like protein 4 [Prosopis cineraria]|uniref:disease resistance RPP13-like protein 4 n=1 Tax=Prosopis cineraria TaxID=364024 RepID=UPI0024109571|nr:disease resistance RPP13-like protein 4 [Prosopis cineraria]
MQDAGKNPIFKCLRVSYELLEKDLKDCLLLLANFPENAVLKKMLLIYWWIGEGLVTDEEKGEKIFDDLLELELIMPHRNDKCPLVNKCQIHPWIRYMLIIVAEKAKILSLDDGMIPRFDTDKDPHRTCLIVERSNVTSKNGSEMENLKSIFNVNQSYLDLQLEWFAKLKSLEVLQLGRWLVSSTHHIEVRSESFLKGLRTQRGLKYLSLRGVSRITELPSFIGELVNLEILDLKACHNLETLRADIVSLKKLTHLDVSECYLLESMPKGLGKLTRLQVLKGFIIGSSQETTIGIEDLRKLEKLERLSIHIGSESVINDEFKKLEGLRNVRCLKISWGVWLNPSRLEKLDKLYIMGGNLGSLGQVQTEEQHWNVKYLILKYTDKLQIDKQTLRKLFPSIEYAKKVRWIKGGGTSTTSGRQLIDFELNN